MVNVGFPIDGLSAESMQMKKTKIAIVIPTHWEYLVGGSQMQARFLVQALKEQEAFDIVYITCRVATDYEADDHRIVRIGKYGKRHKYGFFWDAVPLYKILKSEQPDIIYQRVACAHTGICAAYSRTGRAKLIWHVASSSDCEKMPLRLGAFMRPHKLIEKKLIEYGLRRANLIVVQTKDQMLALDQNYGRRCSQLVRNFHPIPLEPEKEYERIEVLWVGNFKDCKRPEKFLDLAELLEEIPSLSFTMVGAPYPDEQEQNEFNRRIGALSHAEYLGGLTQEQVKERMSSAHVLVNTSTREGFSNTFIEAWMHSMVVLSIDVNPDNMLNGGPLGKSCENLEELAGLLKELAANPDKLGQMGREARVIATQEFSMANAMKLVNLISGIANKPQEL